MSLPETGPRPVVRMTGIRKRFGVTEALRGVDFTAYKGFINAVIGENGAGKTTLMKVLFGLLHSDSGELEVNGNRIAGSHSARRAIALGIGMLQQHFSLVPAFPALENIILGCEPVRGIQIDRRQARQRLEEIFVELGGGVDLNRPIAELSVSERQLVEIARMLFTGAEILIFDEPTATLAPQEIENLYRLLRRLADEGRTVILITHRLREVIKHADMVTVLRRGLVTAGFERVEMNEERLIGAIVPEAADLLAAKKCELPSVDEQAEPVVELRGVDCTDQESRTTLSGVSLRLRPGEILGIAGVTGSGQKELAEAVIGLRPPAAGSILLSGRDVSRLGVKDRRKLGVVYIPEDRFADGVIPPFSLVLNRLLGDHRVPGFRCRGSYRLNLLREDVKDKVGKYHIDAGDLDASLASLSGGNQQKLMLARELDREPRLIVAHGPTRGLDVVAARRCYERMLELASQGDAVLLISTELEDLLAYAHRIAVLFAGMLIDAGASSELDARKIGLLMTRGSAA